MIPILSTTGTLTGQGLGRLTEALSCIVTHEVNGEYELRMTYPVTGERYADIAENLVVWAEPDNLTPAQAFRIYRITRPLNGIVTIYARHIAYDMSGIVVKPFTASTLTTALSSIAPNSSPSCPFTLTSTRTVATQMKVSVPTVLWGLLGGQSGSFLDIYGGEWDFNNYTAELKTTLGTDRGVTVRYGKNLTKLEQDVTIEATYAGVFPFWYDEQSGVLVKLSTDYISIPGATGSRLLLLDLSDEWETAPTEVQLQARANAYITANDPGTPKISWKVNMAMLSQSEEFANLAILEQVMLGDTIHVYYEPMNLTASARAVKLEYDVLLERYNTVTLGRVKQNMAQIVAAEKKETAQAFKSMKSTLEKAIDSATDFITNPSGEMRFIYDANDVLQEIVVLDNPDISQAQSVWRLNSGGYGHSSTGYAGPYTLAITQNGAIVADFITAGTMAGNRVRTGLIQDETNTNYWNLDTGKLHIEALTDFGGRNYWWALDPKIHPEVTLQYATVTYDEENNGEYVVTCSQTNNSFSQVMFPANVIPIPSELIGQKMTVHADYVAASGTNDPRIYYVIADSNGQQIASNYVDANSLSYTFTVPNGAVSLRPLIRVRQTGANVIGESVTVRGIKLEKGTVKTDWSPAPEDAVNGGNIISKINVSSESIVIAASKVDLTGYVTFTNLSTSGQTTIDGGNITTGLIKDAANKNSWNLTTGALSITDGSINITTNSSTEDKIILSYISGLFEWANKISPSGITLSYQSGAISERRIDIWPFIGGIRIYDADGAYCGMAMSRVWAGGKGFGGQDGEFQVYDSAGNIAAELEKTGLTFTDANNTTTALYPSYGLFLQDFTSKNLLQITAKSTTVANITYTVNADGTVYAQGVSNGYAELVLNSSFPVTTGAEYVVTGLTSAGSTSTYFIRIARGNNTYIDVVTDVNGTTFTAPVNTCRISIVIPNGSDVSGGVTFKPMMRKAEVTDTTFTPWVGTAAEREAIYPTTGWPQIIGSASSESIGTSWTRTTKEYTTPKAGWYMFRGTLNYTSSRPRGVALIQETSGYTHPIAITETTENTFNGDTVSSLNVTACAYIGANLTIALYAKSASVANNSVNLYVHGPIA